MIKATIRKTVYSIHDDKTNNAIGLVVTEEKIKLLNTNGTDCFVFKNRNTADIRKRWRNIAKLIDKAMIMVERNEKQPKEFV